MGEDMLSLFSAMEGEEEEDRLSSLLDSLIIEIISRLPDIKDDTKEATRTCILSKQWKHLWTQVPNLVFQHLKHNENKDTQSLIDLFSYLDKTITHSSHLNLSKFILSTHYDDKFESQVNNSILHAINCNVQQFYLWLSHMYEDEEDEEDECWDLTN
ncbi:F-box protein-like protein [Tanacetum coccineum]